MLSYKNHTSACEADRWSEQMEETQRIINKLKGGESKDSELVSCAFVEPKVKSVTQCVARFVFQQHTTNDTPLPLTASMLMPLNIHALFSFKHNPACTIFCNTL